MTFIFYPILTSFIFPLDKTKLKKVCRLTPNFLLSCMLGSLFHILLDFLMHPYNPIFWPFINPYDIVGLLVLAFAVNGDLELGFLYARILNYVIMGGLMILIIVKNRKNLWEKILVVYTY
ncbi:MAG: hypothetical protein ACFFA7_07115 [Promethearchaeota archaeon]